MLDSLVRVSRRVGWATDGRPLTLMPRRVAPSRQNAHQKHCTQSSQQTPRRAKARHGGESTPRSASRPATADCNTRRRDDGSPFCRAHDGSQTGRGTGPRKVHAPTNAQPPPSPRGSRTTADARRHAESRGPYSRPHPFASKRFHVLLNSLFKVLFNFPSRYLSAIGLVSVFSLRWSLPPA